MPKLRKASKIVILNSILILVLCICLGSSLAYLTSTGSTSGTFKMGEVKAEATYTVNGVTNSETSIILSDLAYIDLGNNYKTTSANIFNSMATFVDVVIVNTGTADVGNISIRNKVEIIDSSNNKDIEGLVYLIILDINDESKNTSYKDESGNILYNELIESIVNDTNYMPENAVIGSYSDREVYQAIQNYNISQLKSFYEDDNRVLYSGIGEASFRVAFFGDYNGLSEENKKIYLEKNFNVTIKVSGLQNVDGYQSGGPNYEEDN